MTNPTEDNRIADGTGFSDTDLRRALQQATHPESRTAQLVRLRATAVEAYTALYQVYEELRDLGLPFAWSAAYEASGSAGILLAQLGEDLKEHQDATPPPGDGSACRSTQHCAAWGWCHRCDPRAGEAARFVVKAVSMMKVPGESAGGVYAACMDLLRSPAQPVKEDTREVRCNLAMTRMVHERHTWEPQPGITGIVCPGYQAPPGEEPPCPGK